MTDSVTYSRPSAEAAYKLAVETNELDMWTDNLSILSRTIISGDVKAIIAVSYTHLTLPTRLLV